MKLALEGQPTLTEIPEALHRSSPRPVALRLGGKAALAMAIILAAGAVASGVLLYRSAAQAAELRQLRRDEPISTQAQVIHLDRTRDKNPRRVIRYQYTADGRSYQGTAYVGLREFRELKVGSPLMVAYLASRPQVSWIPGHEYQGTPWPAVALIPASMLVVAGALVYTLRRERSLLEEGRPALARVLKSTRHGGRSRYRVEFEFQLLSGAMHTGQMEMTSSPATGSNLVILYDPEQPKRLMRYPSLLVRVDFPA